MVKQKKVFTEKMLVEMIQHTFPPDGHCTLAQVRNQTGIQKARVRTADAISFGLWPSRGYDITGFEVKVSRTDFLKEIAEPSKAEEFAQYCDFWYIVTPPGLVRAAELPENWGLMEAVRLKVKVVKKAKRLEAKPFDKAFLCGVMRAFYRQKVGNDELNEAFRKGRAQGEEFASRRAHWDKETELTQAQRESKRLRESIEIFENATGIDLNVGHWKIGQIGKAAHLLADKKALDKLRDLQRGAVDAAAVLQFALDQLEPET